MGIMMESLAPILSSVPPMMMLAMVYLITLIMTELMTNNAAAALMFPLGYGGAVSSGYDPMAFVMAVALGGSASFMTPFGYTTNLMVQNLGGYTRVDYVRFGWLGHVLLGNGFSTVTPRLPSVNQIRLVMMLRHFLMSCPNHR